MRLGFVGLGKMGGNMVLRLLEGGHEVVAFDPDPQSVARVRQADAQAADSIAALMQQLSEPRVIWLMVPSGSVTEQVIDELAPMLSSGDLLVDGGNSWYKDSMRRAARLAGQQVLFLDVGTSGGIWGLEEGYCLMAGGSDAAFALAAPALRTLAPPDGYAHVGPSGAGHYVKMVHNAIEYVMLQGYAEGFELLQSRTDFALDLAQISQLWLKGSVVRSWLLELARRALTEDPQLESIEPYVEDTGEGRWAAIESIESAVPAPALALALQMRFRSREANSFAARFIAAERRQFGGHPVRSRRHG